MESFVVAMIRSLRLERTTHLGSIRFPDFGGGAAPAPVGSFIAPGPEEADRLTFSHSKPPIPPHPSWGSDGVALGATFCPAHVDVAAEGAAMNGIVDPVENDPKRTNGQPGRN